MTHTAKSQSTYFHLGAKRFKKIKKRVWKSTATTTTHNSVVVVVEALDHTRRKAHTQYVKMEPILLKVHLNLTRLFTAWLPPRLR
jgi:hypothetical protein